MPEPFDVPCQAMLVNEQFFILFLSVGIGSITRHKGQRFCITFCFVFLLREENTTLQEGERG